MTNENAQYNSCNRADELVSYLYNEMRDSEKARFEKHLSNCFSCADELADFSLVRSSIAEWRSEEFQPIPTPIIELSVQNSVSAPAISASNTFLARLRALFSLSPAWMAAGAAALVIGIGLFLVAVNFKREPETARIENKAESETLSGATTNKNTDLQTNISENHLKSVSKSSPEPPIIREKEITERNEKAAAKLSPSVIEKKTGKIVSERTAKSVKPVLKKANQSPPPTLMADEDEYEDNSLRLSDIFRGVGGK